MMKRYLMGFSRDDNGEIAGTGLPLLVTTNSGSPSVVVQLRGAVEDTLAEQIELCPAVHLAFQQFEPVDLSFGLPLTPR